MGTEVAISFSTLRDQLENEKSSLYKIDENIKKFVQTSARFPNNRYNNASGDYSRGSPRLGGRNSFLDGSNNYKNDTLKKSETKTVFSRLSGRSQDSDGEDDGPGTKRVKISSAVSRELPTRAAILRAQGGDEQARTRNRRIFGSLLGTLQKFKQEEIVLQTKVDKKAQVERKIEEQARLEKEREQQERKILFAEREHKKATIKALEAKMGRVQEFEQWEASQKSLSNFILTKVKPHIYWLPKKMNEKASEKLDSSRKFHEKYLIRKRQELQEELQRIEQHCLRNRGAGAKENDPENNHNDNCQDKETTDNIIVKKEEDQGKKRDKFAMDVDEKDKEDSDGEVHDESEHKQENGTKENGQNDETVMDETKTDNIEQNTTIQSNNVPEDTTISMEVSTSEDPENPATEDNNIPETTPNSQQC